MARLYEMPSGNILCEWKNHENIPFIPLPDHQHMIFTLSNLLFSPIDKGPHLNAFWGNHQDLIHRTKIKEA
jgi:hypothetical protein